MTDGGQPLTSTVAIYATLCKNKIKHVAKNGWASHTLDLERNSTQNMRIGVYREAASFEVSQVLPSKALRWTQM